MSPRAARGQRLPLKLVLTAAIGIVVAVLSGTVAGSAWFWADSVLLGWAAYCLSFTVWTWLHIWRMDAEQTRNHATAEDPGRAVTELLVLAASVASLAGVAVVLLQARTSTGIDQGLFAGLALVSVALSWLLIHTLYSVRYARMYFAAPVGGIDFNQPEPPRYSDFAYLSFDLGMTFQVSDTTLRSSEFRRVVLAHTLLSYLFGTVILATVINLVAGL